jgi:hypothetical protein
MVDFSQVARILFSIRSKLSYNRTINFYIQKGGQKGNNHMVILVL